jgi:DNA-binding response OmpR family regulator
MSAKPSTILIVDDDLVVIEQLVTHFRRRNYEPIATANPTVVEQTLDAFEVHLILLDLRMERLNGYDVLKKIRARGTPAPVLIITAYYEDEKENLARAGVTADHVIEKPFRDFAKIEARINKTLNRVVAPGEVGSEYEDEIYFGNRTKVVLVDDEPEITEILAEILRERHYDVVVFANGQAALDYLRADANACHVAIVDMALPGLTGDRIIEEALRVKPKIKFIPVSARYEDEVRERLTRAGMDPSRLVTKPFDLPTLIEKIKVLATEAGTLG